VETVLEPETTTAGSPGARPGNDTPPATVTRAAGSKILLRQDGLLSAFTAGLSCACAAMQYVKTQLNKIVNERIAIFSL
jgi:hypothetical protein